MNRRKFLGSASALGAALAVSVPSLAAIGAKTGRATALTSLAFSTTALEADEIGAVVWMPVDTVSASLMRWLNSLPDPLVRDANGRLVGGIEQTEIDSARVQG